MKLYGLIGFPLTHSFSENYFSEKFKRENICDAIYKNFPIEDISKIHNLLFENQELAGFNITIPYKEKIIPYLNEIDVVAKNINAVNVVKILKSKNKLLLKGYNTDILGFDATLKKILNYKFENVKALILGNGGAAKAVKYVLDFHKIQFKVISRQLDIHQLTYKDLTEQIINKFKLIINTTPLGMYPNIENYPNIPYNYISSSHVIIDIIYNPAETVFIKKCLEKGAAVTNGLLMLQIQAEEAWKIWNE